MATATSIDCKNPDGTSRGMGVEFYANAALTTPLACEVGKYADGSDWFYHATQRVYVKDYPAATTLAAGTWLFEVEDPYTIIAATNRLQQASNRLFAGQKVRLASISTTTGISTGVDYYVVNPLLDSNGPPKVIASVQLALTPGGAAITLTGNGSCTLQRYGMLPREINGLMVNYGNSGTQYGGTGSTATNNGGSTGSTAYLQGFDSQIYLQDLPSGFPDPTTGTEWIGSTNQAYAPGLNKAFGKTGVALNYGPTEEASLQKAWAEVPGSGRGSTADMIVVTKVKAIPAAGSFRPGMAVLDKTSPFNVSELDFSVLKNLTAPAGSNLDHLGNPQNLSTFRDQFKGPLTTGSTNNLFVRFIMGNNASLAGHYGRDIQGTFGEALLFLHLNATNAAKTPLVTALLTIANDVRERAIEGGTWPGGTGSAGGGNNWPKGFVVLAARMLRNASVGESFATWADYQQKAWSGADRQYFITPQNAIDTPRSPPPSEYTTDPFLPYTLDTPEWQCNFPTNGQVTGSGSGMGPNSKYRIVIGPSMIGVFLGVQLLDGGEAAWNNSAAFGYHYRFLNWMAYGTTTIKPIILACDTLWTEFVHSMVAAYLPAYPSAVPALQSTKADGEWVWFTFDKLLDAKYGNTLPATSDFTCTVNGSPVAITATAVHGLALAVKLATPLVNTSQVVRLSYTPGAVKARTLSGIVGPAGASVYVPTITSAVAVNRTGLPPPAAASKDSVYSNGVGHLLVDANAFSQTNQKKVLVGVRFKPNQVGGSAGPYLLSNLSPSTTNFRYYAPLNTAFRIFWLGDSVRPLNSLTAADIGVAQTHWFLIDYTKADVASGGMKYTKNGAAMDVSTSNFTSGKTFDVVNAVPAGLSFLGNATAAFDTAISEVCIKFGDAAYAMPADLTTANFGTTFDWGANGENVLAGPMDYYWCGTIDEWNGALPNRGAAGSYAANLGQELVDNDIEPFTLEAAGTPTQTDAAVTGSAHVFTLSVAPGAARVSANIVGRTLSIVLNKSGGKPSGGPSVPGRSVGMRLVVVGGGATAGGKLGANAPGASLQVTFEAFGGAVDTSTPSYGPTGLGLRRYFAEAVPMKFNPATFNLEELAQ